MADRVLLSGFRLRIGDSNFDAPGVFPYRLVFTDSSTSNPKEVYSAPADVANVSLGSYVILDADGYVPASGVWLDEGRYHIDVQRAITINPDPQKPEEWASEYTINYVQGAKVDVDQVLQGVNSVPLVVDVRGLTGSQLSGIVLTSGYLSTNDGGEGGFIWVSSSLQADDSGAYLLPNGQSAAVPGRWHRLMPTQGSVSIALWGAVAGVLDVTGQIERADIWCARSSDSTGTTLVFPAGEYAIGASVITLNRTGLNDAARSKNVAYHVKESATFISFGGGKIVFVGPTIIDSDSLVSNDLEVLRPVDGMIKPEWWGAVANVDAFSAFQDCYNNPGDHTILLTQDYLIENGGLASAQPPTLLFRGFATITYNETDGPVIKMDVGDVIKEQGFPGAMFYGNVGQYRLRGSYYKASWFFVNTQAAIKNIHDGIENSIEWNWDQVTDVGVGFATGDFVTNTFGDLGALLLFDSITLGKAVLPDRQIFLYGAGFNGLVNLPKFTNYKAIWFGGVGGDVGIELNHMFRSLGQIGKDGDFFGAKSNIQHDVNLPMAGHSISLHGLYLISASNNDFNITDPSNLSTVSLNNPTLLHIDFNATVFRLNTVNLDTFGGFVFVTGGVYTFIKGSSIFDTPIQIEGSENGGRYLRDSLIVNSPITLIAETSARLMHVEVANNTFKSTIMSDGEHFIGLLPFGINNILADVKIRGNDYSINNAGVTENQNIVNVADVGNETTATWSASFEHKISIYDEKSGNGDRPIYDLNFDPVFKLDDIKLMQTIGRSGVFIVHGQATSDEQHGHEVVFVPHAFTLKSPGIRTSITIEGAMVMHEDSDGSANSANRPEFVSQKQINTDIDENTLTLEYGKPWGNNATYAIITVNFRKWWLGPA